MKTEVVPELKTIKSPYVIGDMVYLKEAASKGFLVRGRVIGLNFRENSKVDITIKWLDSAIDGSFYESDLFSNVVPALDLIISHHEKAIKEFQEKREKALQSSKGRKENAKNDGSASQQVNEEGREKAD